MLKANAAAVDALAFPGFSAFAPSAPGTVPTHGVVAVLSHSWMRLEPGGFQNPPEPAASIAKQCNKNVTVGPNELRESETSELKIGSSRPTVPAGKTTR